MRVSRNACLAHTYITHVLDVHDDDRYVIRPPLVLQPYPVGLCSDG